MESVVHDSSVHIVVEDPAGGADERRHKVFVRVPGYPESTAIITKEVIYYLDCFGNRDRTSPKEALDVDIKPGVPGPFVL